MIYFAGEFYQCVLNLVPERHETRKARFYREKSPTYPLNLNYMCTIQ